MPRPDKDRKRFMTLTTITPSTRKLLAYRMLRGVGPAKLRLLTSSRDIESIVDGSDEPTGVTAIDKAIVDVRTWATARDDAQRQVEAALLAGARILSAVDPDYPPLLKQSSDDPFLLYVRGVLPKSGQHTVAVIGTREPTHHGEIIATRVTEFLVNADRSVVSGLALGCDAVAHRSCLRQGGHTVAVLAHGLQTVAPSSHRDLAEEIVACGGALVSEYPFGVAPSAPQYVRRDLTQAGLSDGVVMVQSDLTGGSLHASRAALKYRRWLAVPYPTTSDLKAGAAKVRANLVLAEGPQQERIKLLECAASDLARIHVLRSRDDYNLLL